MEKHFSKTMVALCVCVWRRGRHTGCLIEKFTIMYSSSVTFQERRVSTSLFFNGFGQRPEKRAEKGISVIKAALAISQHKYLQLQNKQVLRVEIETE